jgi:diguanylate cyclase (GGDEF)-like protein/PAS domain S-box-containing protein
MPPRPRPFSGRSTHAVIGTDAFGRIRTWDGGAAAMFGHDAAEVVGRRVCEVIAAPAAVVHASAAQARMTHGQSWSGELALATRAAGSDDHGVSCAVTVEPVAGEDGTVVAGVWICTDVKAQRQAQHALRRLSTLIDCSGDAVVSTDLDGVVTAWNSRAEQLYGWSSAEMVGRPFVDLVPADRRAEFDAVLETMRSGVTRRAMQTARLRADGTRIEVSVTAVPVYEIDGALAGITTVSRDVTEQRQLERAMAHHSTHDELTGLLNRRSAEQRLQSLLADAEMRGSGAIALFIAVDRFATVNEAWGHSAGDVLLAELAGRLRGVCRPADVLARFGGDEFLIVTEQSGSAAAFNLAGRVHRAVSEPMTINGHRVTCTASVGVALTPPYDVESLLHHAATAAADAKNRGRARTRIYDAELAHRAQTRLTFASELGTALAEDKLELRYQPIFDTASGAVLGVEALTRWVHPTHGDVAPAEFLRLAEDTGLIVDLDTWVLNRACAEMARLLATGVVPPSAQLAVNISERTLVDARLSSLVANALVSAQLSATSLVVEVTETGVMADPDSVLRALEGLRSRGVGIALDDFGTGHAGLAHLRRFPLTSIKIDQAFIQTMCTDADELTIVASVVDLARALGVTAIAEGVETHAQLDLLRRLGCPAAQGFLWCEALRPDDLFSLLTSSRAQPLTGAVQDARRRTNTRKADREITADHGLRRLLQLHQEGQSATTIAAALNADGYRTPQGQRWHPRTVERALVRFSVGVG